MKKEIIEFGKRMDAAEDKALLVDYAEGATRVLDLGAGTGKISRDIAEKYGAHCDAIDIQFKDNCQNSDGVTYYGMSIKDFFMNEVYGDTKYDCIILSAILHELSESDIGNLEWYLPKVMADNCRIIIREPFYGTSLGPVVKEEKRFIDLVSSHISAKKAIEYIQTPKLSDEDYTKKTFCSSTDWANLAFVVSYGEQSWEREKHELRYARDLNWLKEKFNLRTRPFTGFQVYSVLDKTYRDHFIKAGIPGEAFDLIQYTGMIIVIDYSK